MNAPRARVSQFCPRCGQANPNTGRAWVDLETNDVVVDSQRIRLTASQAELIYALLEKMPRVASRGHLLRRIYNNFDSEAEAKIIDVWICKVRPKIEGTALSIETVWGRGYRASLEAVA